MLQMFDEWAAGRSMQAITERQGCRLRCQDAEQDAQTRAFIDKYYYATSRSSTTRLCRSTRLRSIRCRSASLRTSASGRHARGEDTGPALLAHVQALQWRVRDAERRVRAPRGGIIITMPDSVRSSAVCRRRAKTTLRTWCCSRCTTLSTIKRTWQSSL